MNLATITETCGGKYIIKKEVWYIPGKSKIWLTLENNGEWSSAYSKSRLLFNTKPEAEKHISSLDL